MKEYEFKTNVKAEGKKQFLKKTKILIEIGILASGFMSLVGIWYCGYSIYSGFWAENPERFAQNLLYYGIMLCVFVSLVKILADEKPFSRTLTSCIQVIGWLFLFSAFVFPRLPGYVSSGFEILRLSENFVLADGSPLLFGILFLVLSALLKAGFEMQRELDEIL